MFPRMGGGRSTGLVFVILTQRPRVRIPCLLEPSADVRDFSNAGSDEGPKISTTTITIFSNLTTVTLVITSTTTIITIALINLSGKTLVTIKQIMD